MRFLWWVVRFTFWVIVYVALGVALPLVHLVRMMIRSVARLADGDHPVQSSLVDSASAISQGASGQGSTIVPAPQMWRPSFPDVAISVREASEALLSYEQRAFRVRSEMRETATRTLETIAQTRALMAQVDAAAAEPVVPVAIVPPSSSRCDKVHHLPPTDVSMMQPRFISRAGTDCGNWN